MTHTVTNPDVGQLTELVLDLGEEVTGLVARTASIERFFRALGQADQAATPTDPVSARAAARKRRIEQSGLRLVQGGGAR